MIVELFAGAGGATLGLRRIPELTTRFHLANEINGAAVATWLAAHSDVGNIVQQPASMFVRWLRSRSIFLLWSSPPCQKYSRAGKGVGYDGWPDTQTAIEQARPQFVIVENVIGSPVAEWKASLEALGYTAAVWLLDAADYGVPQQRRRVFLVGALGACVLVPPPHCARRRSMGEALPQLPGSFVRTEQITAKARSVFEPAPTVSKTANHYVYADDRGVYRGRGQEIVYARSVGSRAGTEPQWLQRPAPTVTCQKGKGTRASSASGWSFNGGPDRAADAAFLATGRRRLTPEECAVLQAFPRDYPFWGTKSEVYAQIGNAVPPPLAEAVAAALLRSASTKSSAPR